MKIVRVLAVNYLRKKACSVFKQISKDVTYDDVISVFRKERLLSPNFFPEALKGLGYEVFDFIADFPEIHHFWATPPDPHQALVNFVCHHKPEIVYFERAAIHAVPKWIKKKIKNISSVRLISGYWGADLSANLSPDTFAYIDHLFSIDEVLTEQLSRYVPLTDMLRSSFDGHRVSFPAFSSRFREIAFFGTSGYGFADHRIRFLILRHLCQYFPIEMWCDEPRRDYLGELRAQLVRWSSLLPVTLLKIAAHKIQNKRKFFLDAIAVSEGHDPFSWHLKFRPLRHEFPEIVCAPVHGAEYENRIKETKIVFNCHVDNTALYGNMRTYEATGLGALLLTDRPEQMRKLFVPDEEIITYASLEEAKEKMIFLRDHPEIVERIAKKGYERVMRDHTIFSRAQNM
ncbi:MAG: hypothetical protein RL557_513, partial [archaeon]